MQATTIKEVITALDQIIADSVDENNRAGYFASLYKKVTMAVAQKITEGYFDNNERMERLDVVFANFYLDAYDSYRQGITCAASWQLAFDEKRNWPPMILQHLLAGMNAHISLDLGVATALASQGQPIQLVQNVLIK